MPFTDVPILFVSALTKQRLLKALEATVKVYENRQQRIATSKFNEYMLKVIEAYPPPATKEVCKKINVHAVANTNTPVCVFCQYATICKNPTNVTLKIKLETTGTSQVFQIFILEK
jgi:predicted GTPase